MTEIILLGDPVVYRDDIQGFDEMGVVTNASETNFKVLWNDEVNSKIELQDRLRIARLDEVEAQSRLIEGNSDV